MQKLRKWRRQVTQARTARSHETALQAPCSQLLSQNGVSRLSRAGGRRGVGQFPLLLPTPILSLYSRHWAIHTPSCIVGMPSCRVGLIGSTRPEARSIRGFTLYVCATLYILYRIRDLFKCNFGCVAIYFLTFMSKCIFQYSHIYTMCGRGRLELLRVSRLEMCSPAPSYSCTVAALAAGWTPLPVYPPPPPCTVGTGPFPRQVGQVVSLAMILTRNDKTLMSPMIFEFVKHVSLASCSNQETSLRVGNQLFTSLCRSSAEGGPGWPADFQLNCLNMIKYFKIPALTKRGVLVVEGRWEESSAEYM